MKIKVGCCGFPGGKSKYFKEFNLVEVQSTFYKLPLEKTASRWREEAGKEFEFCLKAWQALTHPVSSPTWRKAGIKLAKENKEKYGYFKQTKQVFGGWSKTCTIANLLDASFILIQCPASFTPNKENVQNFKKFFSKIKERFKIAWEPRGEWLEKSKLIKKLCKLFNLVHCVDPFKTMPKYINNVAYFRLHGSPPGKRMYKYQYTDKDLEKLKQAIFSVNAKEVYVLFNNYSMKEDAKRFLKLI